MTGSHHSAHIAALLDELQRIPAASLPADTHAALAEAIRCGEIDGLYRPFGSQEWNVTFSGLAPSMEPRMPLTAWVEHWRAGRSPIDTHIWQQTLAQTRAQVATMSAEVAACRTELDALRQDVADYGASLGVDHAER